MSYEKPTYNQGRSQQKDHELKLVNRRKLEVQGVEDVDSFDTEEFLLKTTQGYLVIQGHNLHMKNLNVEQGLLTIQGRIASFSYIDDDQKQSKSLLGKLFK
ncbi:sporulation protein YabP [Allobacillus sp. GCM10007491]|uniref:Sporulation protein YabP n=1 Tax=Allobacillus saliphilus TaxID=2912308 RepID=A0A941CUQ0_9BACI|nr:sporulation protein YabP [Allobacillus saliphilus]MBR7554308.1 sporulation protein YabP [Allobacillus saliphilus]